MTIGIHRTVMNLGLAFFLVGAASTSQMPAADGPASGVEWAEPKVIDPGPVGGPPSDAIVLFDGKDLSKWNGGDKWEIHDGYAIAKKVSISTKEGFGDCQLHIEWAAPAKVRGSGQDRGNSGVYLMGKYEVQVLDSYGNKTYYDGQAGAIYKQHPPMVNACRKPGEWQTYDIIFNAPQFDHIGNVLRPAYITVLQNGVVVQNHEKIYGTTYLDVPAHYEPHPAKAPIGLQYHGHPVRFRNIWVREIHEAPTTPKKS